MTGVTRPLPVPSVLFPSCDQGGIEVRVVMFPSSTGDITDHVMNDEP